MSRFEVYQDAGGEWRWRLKAGNGRILSGPEEGFKTKRGALRNIQATKAAAALAKVTQAR